MTILWPAAPLITLSHTVSERHVRECWECEMVWVSVEQQSPHTQLVTLRQLTQEQLSTVTTAQLCCVNRREWVSCLSQPQSVLTLQTTRMWWESVIYANNILICLSHELQPTIQHNWSYSGTHMTICNWIWMLKCNVKSLIKFC